MNTRLRVATCATLSVGLVVAAVFTGAPAMAEDAPPPEDTTTAVVVTEQPDPVTPAEQPAQTPEVIEPVEPSPSPTGSGPALDNNSSNNTSDESVEEGESEVLASGDEEAMMLMGPMALAAAAPTLVPCVATKTVVITSEGQLTYADKLGGTHSLQVDGMHIDWHHVTLSESKSAGYVATNVDYADICTPSLDFVNSTGEAAAGLNLEVYVDGVRQGYIIQEPGIPNFWANFTIPNVSADPTAAYRKAIGTLQDFYDGWWADDPNHVITLTQAGYSGGSGSQGNGIIKSVTLGDTKYVFAAPAPVTCTPGGTTNVLVTDTVPQGFNASPTGSPAADMRLKGHIEFVPGGINQVTENTTSQSKSWYGRTVNVPATQYCGGFALATVLNSGTIKAGLNVGWDLNNDGTMDFLSTVEPGVYTKTYWSNTAGVLPPSDPANPGNNNGQGGPYSGEVNDILAKFPDAHVVLEALVQGSGVQTDSVTSSFTTPAYVYTFDRSAKPADVVKPALTETQQCTTQTVDRSLTTEIFGHTWSGRSEWNGATFVMNNTWVQDAAPYSTTTVLLTPRAMNPTELAACPAKPTPPTGSTGGNISNGPNALGMTGSTYDPRDLYLWAVLLVIAGLAAFALRGFRKEAANG